MLLSLFFMETKMKKIDAVQVKKIAELSKLGLSDSEINEFTGQLSAILEYVEKINEVNTDGVEPLVHCLGVTNRFREDVVCESLGVEKTLANAPDTDGDFFKVPKILDDNCGA